MTTQRSSPLPQILTAGRGFETEARRCEVEDFIIVDGSLPAGLRTPLHVHERAYFAVILQGDFVEHYESTTVRLTPAALNFVPAGTPHRTNSNGARVIRLEFPDNLLADAGPHRLADKRPRMLTHPATLALTRRVAAESKTRIAPWLRSTREKIDAEWNRVISLKHLAASAGVHPVHLARAFRSRYGCSIGEYRRRCQLKAAEDLVRCTQRDLRDVALSCGFVDQSHLSKAFRNAFGTSPGRYRRVTR